VSYVLFIRSVAYVKNALVPAFDFGRWGRGYNY